jgi:ATP-dependent Lon protease
LPIGGLREKSLAALRARIYTIIAPEQNQKDLGEIPKHLRRRLDFRFVKHMDEVLKIALTEFPAKENIIDADADSKKKSVPKAKKEATSKPDGGEQPSDGK